MKRGLIKLELALFGHCYSASPETEPGSLPGARLTFAVPSKTWAEHTAARRTRRSGVEWCVMKWGRR